MSTRSVKLATSAALVICGVMLLGWPILVSNRPGPRAPIAETKSFALMFAGYVTLIVLFLVLAGIGAIVILRRTAAEYRSQQMENMRELVEATLADHRSQNEPRVE